MKTLNASYLNNSWLQICCEGGLFECLICRNFNMATNDDVKVVVKKKTTRWVGVGGVGWVVGLGGQKTINKVFVSWILPLLMFEGAKGNSVWVKVKHKAKSIFPPNLVIIGVFWLSDYFVMISPILSLHWSDLIFLGTTLIQQDMVLITNYLWVNALCGRLALHTDHKILIFGCPGRDYDDDGNG